MALSPPCPALCPCGGGAGEGGEADEGTDKVQLPLYNLRKKMTKERKKERTNKTLGILNIRSLTPPYTALHRLIQPNTAYKKYPNNTCTTTI